MTPQHRKFFQEIGRRGGLIGGRRTALNMTPQQRIERAKKAVAARWAKAKRRKKKKRKQ